VCVAQSTEGGAKQLQKGKHREYRRQREEGAIKQQSQEERMRLVHIFLGQIHIIDPMSF
jgi:hypothetical protein